MTNKQEEVKEFEVITRNFSSKYGGEMFSLTLTRRVDVDSTFYRKRAEMYIALYDVQVQLLEELVVCGFEEKMVLDNRKTNIRKQFNALRKKMEEEINSGELTEHQIQLINETFIDIDIRSN